MDLDYTQMARLVEAPRGTILKSVDGIPDPIYPPGIDLKRQARTARRRFYPVTLLYTLYGLPVIWRAARVHLWSTLAFVALGIGCWTLVEYLVHRFVLHGRFPDGRGLRHTVHRFFDTSHGDHHLRPWDGMYINGFLDTLPFALLLAGLSWLFPLATAPVFVAALLVCYVAEEWVHYSVHFHRFRWRYFDYIRRHHLYHHSPRGKEIAFGLTNSLWDVALETRIPAADRRLLYRRGVDRAAVS
jgi:sterol desaturase/sphingolipid hydroxylase (fatty acid hydroxylase superfamily)